MLSFYKTSILRMFWKVLLQNMEFLSRTELDKTMDSRMVQQGSSLGSQ